MELFWLQYAGQSPVRNASFPGLRDNEDLWDEYIVNGAMIPNHATAARNGPSQLTGINPVPNTSSNAQDQSFVYLTRGSVSEAEECTESPLTSSLDSFKKDYFTLSSTEECTEASFNMTTPSNRRNYHNESTSIDERNNLPRVKLSKFSSPPKQFFVRTAGGMSIPVPEIVENDEERENDLKNVVPQLEDYFSLPRVSSEATLQKPPDEKDALPRTSTNVGHGKNPRGQSYLPFSMELIAGKGQTSMPKDGVRTTAPGTKVRSAPPTQTLAMSAAYIKSYFTSGTEKEKTDKFKGEEKSDKSKSAGTTPDADFSVKTKMIGIWNNVKYGWTVNLKTNFSRDSPVYLMGRVYHKCFGEEEQQEEDFNQAEHGMEAFKKDFYTLVWCTYRRQFPTLQDSHLTTDCGWGCMLRSGQMMVAHALTRHFLSRDWRHSKSEVISHSPEDVIHRCIVRWFGDSPSSYCPLSLHNLVHLGQKLGKNAGDWYGPASVAYIFKEAVEMGSKYIPELQRVSVYVAQDCAVHIQDVLDLGSGSTCVCNKGNLSHIIRETQLFKKENSFGKASENLPLDEYNEIIRTKPMSITRIEQQSHITKIQIPSRLDPECSMSFSKEQRIHNKTPLKSEGTWEKVSVKPCERNSCDISSRSSCDKDSSYVSLVVVNHKDVVVNHEDVAVNHADVVINHDKKCDMRTHYDSESEMDLVKHSHITSSPLCDSIVTFPDTEKMEKLQCLSNSKLNETNSDTLINEVSFSEKTVCKVRLEQCKDNPITERTNLKTDTNKSFSDIKECSTCNNWRSVVIMVPVRLGGEGLNPIYAQCIYAMFTHDLFLGIIGGRPKHSLYFVGFQDESLIHLDPHLCQDAVPVTQPSFSLSSYHCSSPRKMSLSRMDPSATLGFYCHTREDFYRLIEDLPEIVTPKISGFEYPIFEFVDGRSSDTEACTRQVSHEDKMAASLPQDTPLMPQDSEEFVFL